MHSYQTAAPWRSCCSLEAACGLQTSPALSGRRRYEIVRQHLCRYSLPDCGCKQTEHRFILTNWTSYVTRQNWFIQQVIYNMYIYFFVLCKHSVCYSYKPFAKSTCDGEAEHDASEDTENRSCPADKESCSQFIPRRTILLFLLFGWVTLKHCGSKITQFLLLCHEHWVKKLWCYPVSIEGASWEWAKA